MQLVSRNGDCGSRNCGISTTDGVTTFGERYPRGNYCARGARFGSHSTEENFYNPMYGKLTGCAAPLRQRMMEFKRV